MYVLPSEEFSEAVKEKVFVMNSFNLTELNRRADEAISACDSAIRIIKNISQQYPVDDQDEEPISWWINSKRVIALYANCYCVFLGLIR